MLNAQVIEDHLIELHDHSSTWQGAANAEKQRILARQHGTALRSHAGDKHKLHLSPASAPVLKHVSLEPIDHENVDEYNVPVDTRGPATSEGNDGLHATHPAVLVPAVRAVAARITAEHAAAGPLRRQYQVHT